MTHKQSHIYDDDVYDDDRADAIRMARAQTRETKVRYGAVSYLKKQFKPHICARVGEHQQTSFNEIGQ